jgi:hypothetical protein
MKFYPKVEVFFDERNILVCREFLALSEYVFTFSKRSYHKEDILKILITTTMKKSIGWECDRRGVFV